MSRGRGEREGTTESLEQTLQSVEPNTGLEPAAPRSQPKLKPRAGHSTHGATRCPECLFHTETSRPYLDLLSRMT